MARGARLGHLNRGHRSDPRRTAFREPDRNGQARQRCGVEGAPACRGIALGHFTWGHFTYRRVRSGDLVFERGELGGRQKALRHDEAVTPEIGNVGLTHQGRKTRPVAFRHWWAEAIEPCAADEAAVSVDASARS